jgi:hypothetical protein
MGKTGLAALAAAAKGNSGSGSRAGYLKIPADSSVTVRFLQELDEAAENYNEDAGLGSLEIEYQDPDNFRKRIVDTTEDEGRCWPAEQGWRPRRSLYIAVLVEESTNAEDVGKVMILNQGFGPKSVTLPLIEYATDYGTICDRPYRIKRSGSGRLDTSYTLIPLKEDAEPYDVSQNVDDIPDWNDVLNHVPYAQQENFFAGSDDEQKETASSGVSW